MIVETPKEFPEDGFIDQLNWLEFSMSDMARNSVLDTGKYFPEQIQATQDSMAAYAGKVIAGGTRWNRYFVAEAPGSQLYVPGNLHMPRYGTNDFVGILQDLQDIPVRLPSYQKDPEYTYGNMLCLELAPIGDQPPERLRNEYEARRFQPFAIEAHSGLPIWVPVRWLNVRNLQFPELEPLPWQNSPVHG